MCLYVSSTGGFNSQFEIVRKQSIKRPVSIVEFLFNSQSPGRFGSTNPIERLPGCSKAFKEPLRGPNEASAKGVKPLTDMGLSLQVESPELRK